MNHDIKVLQNYLIEHLDNLSSEEIDILKMQISFLEEHDRHFNKVLLEMENSKENKDLLNKEIANLKGLANV
tara:strand:- start:134 stop:349 length:216 start_codon:yes stop_codon:yes gene_type:complete